MSCTVRSRSTGPLLALALTLLAAPAQAASAQEVWANPGTGIPFIRVAKGCFKMGVPAEAFSDLDPNLRARIRKTEEPLHEVCLDEFWMGRHEVTKSEWRAVMGGPILDGAPDSPVTGVTQAEARSFAERLGAHSPDGSRFRLPTEAEWEYACRAGAQPAVTMPSMRELQLSAWFSSSYDLPFSGMRYGSVQPVEKKLPNPFGLHDMLGNVWEWTQDSYQEDAYRSHDLYNPLAKAQNDKFVVRGGSIRSAGRILRCEGRAWLTGETRHDTAGFRLVRVTKGENR